MQRDSKHRSLETWFSTFISSIFAGGAVLLASQLPIILQTDLLWYQMLVFGLAAAMGAYTGEFFKHGIAAFRIYQKRNKEEK